ncbi:unnamed protein product [Alopecurus aequalis]
METLQALSNLTSLTRLYLSKLEDSRDECLWPLLAHGRLTELTLYDTPDFFAGSNASRLCDKEFFSSSSKLLALCTNNTGFLNAPISNILSSTLTTLELRFDDEVEGLTEEQEEALQLLTSIQKLRFEQGKKLQRLPSVLHKLANLEKLIIVQCSAIRSLPSLPSCLQEVFISGCGAMKSLPNSLPNSLEILTIYGCKAIRSLPKDGLPSSVRELYVHNEQNSEDLRRECRKLIGTIPIIKA